MVPFALQCLISCVRMDVELIAYEYEGVTVDYLLHHLEHRLAGRQAKYVRQ